MEKQDQTVKITNPWTFSIKLGIYAGVIWGGIYILAYYLGFTKVIPGFLAEPFYKHDYLASWKGHMVGWAFFIVFSVIAAVIYAAFLRKVKGPWPGFIYGFIWWVMLFLLGPLVEMMKPIHKLDLNSILTSACLFLLWGSFIGYTITVEFTDETIREPLNNFKEKNENGGGSAEPAKE